MMKLSGLAVPSCCCGSSQRAAILVCHASIIWPVGTAVAAAVLRTNGVVRTVVASAAVLSTVRRVSVVVPILFSLCISKINQALTFEFDVFPRVGIGGRDRRKHLLPF